MNSKTVKGKALPKGWREVRLGEVASVKTGPFGTQLHQHDYVKSSGTPIVTVEHLSERGLVYKNLPLVSDHDKRRLNQYLIYEGDIVFSRVGSVDRSTLVSKDENGWLFSGRLLRVRPKQKNVHSSYLNYFFHTRRFMHHMRSIAVGGTMPSINTEILSSVTICFPTIKEQKAIASLLETWDTAIEKTEALIAAKEKRFKWLLKTLISDQRGNSEWKAAKLGNICIIRKGEQLNKLQMVETGKYPALNGGVAPSGYTDEWNTPANTVSISEGGNSCGYVNLNTGKFWAGGHCYTLTDLADEINTDFLYYQLKGEEPSIMKLRVGSGLPNIQKGDIDKFPFFFPPLARQKQISHVLSTAQRGIYLLKQLSEKHRVQKRGLMQKLLTGNGG